MSGDIFVRIFSIQNIVLIFLMMGAGGQGGNWLPASISHFLDARIISTEEKFDMGALLNQLRAEQVKVMQDQQRQLMAATAGSGVTFDFNTNTSGGAPSPAAVASTANLSSAGQAEATQVMQSVMAQMGKGDLLNLISEIN